MKRFWIVFPVLLIAGLVMMGCPDGGGGGKGDITWTLSANGAGENNIGTETTTQITINFNKEPAGLAPQNISIAGGPATISNVTGSGKTRTLSVIVTDSGSVSITINKAGIAAGPKSVAVWKEGAEKLNGYTAAANGDSDTTTSTNITFTFDEAVTGLLASDITITAGAGANGGDAAKDTLSGSGTTWTLNILVEKQGIVVVKITKAGIYAGNTNVNVYKAVEVGPPAIPEDGQIASEKWHKLVIDTSGEGGDPASGKGVITGEDFDAIVAATAFKGTYLKIFLDETAIVSGHSGYGIGALGNLENAQGEKDGQSNLGFSSSAPGGYSYADIPLKTLKNYYSADDDSNIFVNIWEGAIRAILLYEPIPAVLEEVLPEGTTELGLASVDNIPGKGFFGTPDLAAINAAKPGSYLELYVANTQTSGNFASIMDGDWNNLMMYGAPSGATEGGDCVIKIMVYSIKYAVGVTGYDANTKHANGTITVQVGINLWSGAYLTKLWLVEPDNGEDPAPPVPGEPQDFELTLTVNGTYGHQGKLIESWLFDDAKITTGDEYLVSFDVESDFALSYVNLSLVDNCEANGWTWTKIGEGASGVYPIGTTGDPKHVSTTITATGTATDNTPEANMLVFETGSETVGENGTTSSIKLTITNFTIVKQP